MPNGGAVRLAEFDALTAPEAAEAMLRCVAIPRWARAVAARRPYGDRGRLLRTARELASTWTWLEVSEALDSWPFLSAGASAAPDGSTAADLHAVSAAYHARFGRSLVVAPSGRTTSDLLRLAVRRLLMDEESERVATTAELREISLRRLRRMIA